MRAIAGKTSIGALEGGRRDILATGEAACELDLVQRAKQGDHQVRDVLAQRYQRLVLLQARRCIRRLRVPGAWDPTLEAGTSSRKPGRASSS